MRKAFKHLKRRLKEEQIETLLRILTRLKKFLLKTEPEKAKSIAKIRTKCNIRLEGKTLRDTKSNY